jgi:hypothetical protein
LETLHCYSHAERETERVRSGMAHDGVGYNAEVYGKVAGIVRKIIYCINYIYENYCKRKKDPVFQFKNHRPINRLNDVYLASNPPAQVQVVRLISLS